MAEEQVNPTVNSLDIAREITVAWLSNPNVNAAASDVPAFLKAMHETISQLSSGATTQTPDEPAEFVPAVPVRSSVKPDYIISLIDGRKFKTLKRHLALQGLTPEAYRERYGLKSDYPMVAPSYSEHRREVARKLGLGRKPAVESAQSAPETLAVAAEATPAKPKRDPAKPRAAKAAAPKAKTTGARASKNAPAAAQSASESIIAEPVPTPTKPISAKRRMARVTASSAEANASPPAAKKQRTVSKAKVVLVAEESATTAPKPRRARKQPVAA